MDAQKSVLETTGGALAKGVLLLNLSPFWRFLKFFDRVNKFNDMRAVVNRQGAVRKMKDRVMAVYLIAIVIFAFFMVLMYARPANRSKAL